MDLPAKHDPILHTYKVQDSKTNLYDMYPFQSFVSLVNANIDLLKSKITENGQTRYNYPIGFFDSSIANKHRIDIDFYNQYIKSKQVVMDFTLEIALKDAKLPVYCIDADYFKQQFDRIKNFNPSSNEYKTGLDKIANDLEKTLAYVAEENIKTALQNNIKLETPETQEYYDKYMKNKNNEKSPLAK